MPASAQAAQLVADPYVVSSLHIFTEGSSALLARPDEELLADPAVDHSLGVLLDANENSIGATVAKPPDTRELNRYPCPYQWELKQLIARLILVF